MFFITITYGTIITFIALYGSKLGLNNIGVIFFPIVAISMLISRPVLGKFLDRYNFSFIIYPSLFFLGIGLFILSIGKSNIAFIIVGIIYGISYGALQTALQTLALINTPAKRIGQGNATFFFWFDAGIGFGSIVGGIIAEKLNYNLMYRIMIIPTILSGILYLKKIKDKSKKIQS